MGAVVFAVCIGIVLSPQERGIWQVPRYSELGDVFVPGSMKFIKSNHGDFLVWDKKENKLYRFQGGLGAIAS